MREDLNTGTLPPCPAAATPPRAGEGTKQILNVAKDHDLLESSRLSLLGQCA
jgi:hypothetical protein